MRRFILPLLAAGSAIVAMAGDHSALSLADRMTLHAERMGISAAQELNQRLTESMMEDN